MVNFRQFSTFGFHISISRGQDLLYRDATVEDLNKIGEEKIPFSIPSATIEGLNNMLRRKIFHLVIDLEEEEREAFNSISPALYKKTISIAEAKIISWTEIGNAWQRKKRAEYRGAEL